MQIKKAVMSIILNYLTSREAQGALIGGSSHLLMEKWMAGAEGKLAPILPKSFLIHDVILTAVSSLVVGVPVVLFLTSGFAPNFLKAYPVISTAAIVHAMYMIPYTARLIFGMERVIDNTFMNFERAI